MHEFSYGVFIGRFQPFHIGHEHVIRAALERVDTLIVVIGSSFQARTPKNPFTYDERRGMLRTVFSHEMSTGRLVVVGLSDYEIDFDWVQALKRIVSARVIGHAEKNGVKLSGTNDVKIALTGYGKDDSSFYLKMFPEWASIQIDTQHGTINATDIRDVYFRRLPQMPDNAVPEGMSKFLREFSLSDEFRQIVVEKQAYARDREVYGDGPFITADALVRWRGKVLLVTRGGDVGNGLLALPGGFVEKNERIFDACLRELAEETTLNDANIADFLSGHVIADNPSRSLRGRVVSTVFLFDVPDEVELKKPVGSDDASHADWYDFSDLFSDNFFEDHHAIISNILSDGSI